jgi:hypothetical protein
MDFLTLGPAFQDALKKAQHSKSRHWPLSYTYAYRPALLVGALMNRRALSERSELSHHY